MGYYHTVSSQREINDLRKEFASQGDRNPHMFILGNDVQMFTPRAGTDPIVLREEENPEAFGALVSNRLLGDSFAYGETSCVTRSELSAFRGFGGSICGSIRDRKLSLSTSPVRDLGFLRECISLTDISGVQGGEYRNMFALGCLETVRLPETLTEIGNCAFAFCVALRDVSIPPSVKNIKAKAFYNCLSLNNIVIPMNVTNIGADAFSKCSALKTVVCLAAAPPSIYTDTFTGIAPDYGIFVPEASLGAYRKEWQAHASRISALPRTMDISAETDADK